MRDNHLTKLAFLALTAAVAIPCFAHATTYIAQEDVDAAVVNLSITTDGAMGALGPSDITGWNIAVTDPYGSGTLTASNSYVEFFENGDDLGDQGSLTATSTALSFNFTNVVSGVLFRPNDDVGAIYCLQSIGGCTDFNDGEIIAGSQFYDDRSTEAESGVQVIATATGVSAAPEPSTWLLMIAGIGGIGLMLRRAKQISGFKLKDAFTAWPLSGQ